MTSITTPLGSMGLHRNAFEQLQDQSDKTIYTIDELLELEDKAVLLKDNPLPDRDFYRLDAKLMKVNNNLLNISNTKKYRSSGGNAVNNKTNSNGSNNPHYKAWVPHKKSGSFDDHDDIPEWLDETNFKIDGNFAAYMSIGTHTFQDFEREKREYHSKHNGLKFAKDNINSAKPAATEGDDLAAELRKQLEEPEILGPTEEEYYSSQQDSVIKNEDLQFALEADSKKEADSQFFTSLLKKSTLSSPNSISCNPTTKKSYPPRNVESKFEDIIGSTSSSRSASISNTIPSSNKRPQSPLQILPPGLDVSSSSRNLMNMSSSQHLPPGLNISPVNDGLIRPSFLPSPQINLQQTPSQMNFLHQQPQIQQSAQAMQKQVPLPSSLPPGLSQLPPGLSIRDSRVMNSLQLPPPPPELLQLIKEGKMPPLPGMNQQYSLNHGSNASIPFNRPPNQQSPSIQQHNTNFPFPANQSMPPHVLQQMQLLDKQQQQSPNNSLPGMKVDPHVQGPQSQPAPPMLPPPSQLPPPLQQKFFQIQQMLVQCQERGQIPPPQLLQEMQNFQRIVQQQFMQK